MLRLNPRRTPLLPEPAPPLPSLYNDDHDDEIEPAR